MSNPYRTKELSNVRDDSLFSIAVKKIQKNFLVIWAKLVGMETKVESNEFIINETIKLANEDGEFVIYKKDDDGNWTVELQRIK